MRRTRISKYPPPTPRDRFWSRVLLVVMIVLSAGLWYVQIAWMVLHFRRMMGWY